MKIYIYGNQSFKKEIHQTLGHSSIKSKFDTDIVIENINSLTKLKQIMSENPKDIYLIDEEKIIRKNSLNKKLKFLAPKDGVEEEFLLESGIADLSLDSMKELPKYIIKKYEELKIDEPIVPQVIENKPKEKESEDSITLDEELAMLLAKGDKKDSFIEESSFPDDLDDISDVEKDINLDDIDNFMNDMDNTQTEEVVDFNDNFGLNNISYDYDDNDILYKEEATSSSEVLENNMDKFEALEFLGEEIIDDEDFTNLDDLDLENNFDFLSKEFDEPKQEIKKEEEINQVDKSFQGDNMDEFFELDSISEKDLLEALNYKIDEKNLKNDYKSADLVTKNETLNVNSTNVDDLSSLISKLLNNKTLEITIKIKD